MVELLVDKHLVRPGDHQATLPPDHGGAVQNGALQRRDDVVGDVPVLQLPTDAGPASFRLLDGVMGVVAVIDE